MINLLNNFSSPTDLWVIDVENLFGHCCQNVQVIIVPASASVHRGVHEDVLGCPSIRAGNHGPDGELSLKKLNASRRALADYGNSSSNTVVHVLGYIVEESKMTTKEGEGDGEWGMILACVATFIHCYIVEQCHWMEETSRHIVDF